MTFEPIRTERLLLRPVRRTDADALTERRNNPDVAKWQTWTLPYPAEQAQQSVDEMAAMPGPVHDEWWMLTIADLADTEIYGDVPIRLTWDGRSAKIGYSLTPTAWGKGYATEAVEAVCARLFDDGNVTRLSAMLHPDNTASAQVLERTGFVFEGHTLLSFWVGNDNSDDWLYGMTREQHTAWTTRPRHPAGDVRLVAIDHTNSAAVAALSTHHSQRQFVPPIEQSFREALFVAPHQGSPVEPWLRAVEADSELVGFVMLTAPTEAHPIPYLWRLLIDRRHQRRGLGHCVLDLIVEHCREAGATALDISWLPGRGSPEPLYVRYGFASTGEIVDGEIEGRLSLA
ncbi:GNAT family N-acetyltransferase [Ilumatobacter sp.]|uniref:GNAT family N-acetyltransferase n=1 Tax=Ilumatobacter sp. TaxID=1967498 RepID=UPI003753A83D